MNTDKPLSEQDLWITPLMGVAHMHPKGSPTSLCGFPWQAQIWNATTEKPKFHCSKCAKLYEQRK